MAILNSELCFLNPGRLLSSVWVHAPRSAAWEHSRQWIIAFTSLAFPLLEINILLSPLFSIWNSCLTYFFFSFFFLRLEGKLSPCYSIKNSERAELWLSILSLLNLAPWAEWGRRQLWCVSPCSPLQVLSPGFFILTVTADIGIF